jgi:hypothetical protein
LQFLSAGVQLVMVAPDFVDAVGYSRRAAMEDSNGMPLLFEGSDDELPNEAISADEKQTHNSVTRRVETGRIFGWRER